MRAIRVVPAIIAATTLLLLCLTLSCQKQEAQGLTEEEAKALMDQYMEIHNEGNLALVDEIFHPEFVLKTPFLPEPIVGIQALKDMGVHRQVKLFVLGGIRNGLDAYKALALGADGVGFGAALEIAMGCRACMACHTGRCPYGITSQDPELRARLDPGTLGKYHDGHAVLHLSGGFFNTFKGRFRIESVDFNISGSTHGSPEEGYFEKLGFSKPSKLNGKTGQKNRYIKIALMIGHVNIRPAWNYIIKSVDGHLDAADKQNAFAPDPGNDVDQISGAGKK